MRADISSRTTIVYKFVFPAIWIPLMGFAAVMALRDADASGGANKSGAIAFGAAWIVFSALLLRFTVPLMRVQLRDGRIYASNYRREVEIAPSEIERVTQNVWMNVRPITLLLRHDTTFGRRIRFLPPSRLSLAFRQEDPLVDQLRRLAGLLPPRN